MRRAVLFGWAVGLTLMSFVIFYAFGILAALFLPPDLIMQTVLIAPGLLIIFPALALWGMRNFGRMTVDAPNRFRAALAVITAVVFALFLLGVLSGFVTPVEAIFLWVIFATASHAGLLKKFVVPA